MKPGWVVLIATLTFLLGAVLGAALGGLVGFGMGAAAASMPGGISNLGQAPPAGVTAAVQAPASVKAGATFTVTVTVNNAGAAPITVTDIDIGNDYLAGARVTSVVPPPAAVDASMGTRTHTYNASIAPGGSAVYTFTLAAASPGTYSGDWDVWFDGMALITSTEMLDVTE